MRIVRVGVCLAIAAVNLQLTHAQAYPTRPVQLVVPSSPGGGTDVTARILSGRLSELLGQQVIVDNRPGAASRIGNEYVARSAPTVTRC